MSSSYRGTSTHLSQGPSRKGPMLARIERDPLDITGVGWSNIERKFSELMDMLDAPVSGIDALRARSEHREKVSAVIAMLLDRAQEESRKLLLEGNGEAAEEAGVKVLKLRERFHGSNSVELVPSYFHLARTKQFLQRYGDAEDMLSLAHFIILKHEQQVSTATKAELHQTFGLMYAADEKLDAAVNHLTCATYYLSCLHGPEHVLTTFSYFDLGNVFAAKASMESAMSLYDAAKEVWYIHLTQVLDEVVAQKAAEAKLVKYKEEGDEEEEVGYASARAFGGENLADASKMLYGIYAIQKERFRLAHPSPTRAAFVLGLFLLWVDDMVEAAKHLLTARVGSQQFYGMRHPVVQEIEKWCDVFLIPYPENPTDAADSPNAVASENEDMNSAAETANTAAGESQGGSETGDNE